MLVDSSTNPKYNKSVILKKFVDNIDEESIFKMASNETNLYGTGGMTTKIEARK